jgi:hypothetical protein
MRQLTTRTFAAAAAALLATGCGGGADTTNDAAAANTLDMNGAMEVGNDASALEATADQTVTGDPVVGGTNTTIGVGTGGTEMTNTTIGVGTGGAGATPQGGDTGGNTTDQPVGM